MDNVPPMGASQLGIVAKACRYFLEEAERRYPPLYDEIMPTLVSTMHFQSFIYPFDWMTECKRDEFFYRDAEKLGDMSLAELRKTFTIHMRMDRFVAGHLSELCRQGYLQRAVRRLLDVLQSHE